MAKYTDEQIKAALEFSSQGGGHVTSDLCYDALNLINCREAEIERLKSKNNTLAIDRAILKSLCKSLQKDVETAKSEAIKEFAERLKKSAFDCDVSFGFGREHYTEAVTVFEIDNLVKEMVGENNA